MDEPTLDPEYFERLKPHFLKLFRKFVKPSNVIHLLQESEMLTETDLSEIKATTNTKGEIEGSVLVFERLTLYEGWYPRLLGVFRDRDVKLSHVAREMEEIKGSLDTAIQEEQQISWHLGIPLFTRGMTSIQHPYDHSSMLLKLSDDHFVQRKKSMKLKVQLEQVQNELNEIKRRLREEENESQLASDSAATTPVHFVHLSDYAELLKKQEEVQTKLARLEEECSDYKLSFEKLEEEKVNEENKNKQLGNIVREKECKLQQYALEKTELEEKLKAYCHENTDLKNKLEASHQEAYTHKTMALNLNESLESEETKNKQLFQQNQTLENSVKEFILEKSNLEEKLKGSHQATIDIPYGQKCQLERILDPNQYPLCDPAIIPRSSLDGGLAPPTLPTMRSAGGSSKRTARNFPVRFHKMTDSKVLLFVGRYGNGITSTINSMFKGLKDAEDIGKDVINVQEKQVAEGLGEGAKGQVDESAIVRKLCASEKSGFLIRTNGSVTAVDGYCLAEHKADQVVSNSLLKAHIKQMVEDTSGFVALIFVLKYGVRFTKQEQDSVAKVKKRFGKTIFKQRGIIVLTYGDIFEEDNYKNNSDAFKNWCESQSGAFWDLLQDCEKRIVLFNNKTSNLAQQQQQSNELLRHVETVQQKNKSKLQTSVDISDEEDTDDKNSPYW
ncbi:uncharacterized protein LOC131935538 [Physella acuta]|uniref:uncharacterized protein LOC131935538 n=1 Tax=Physella acuta TaxID=109671 RepID=UPI0027DAF129|nr:uncharacterized protein LOC131935538 [Physella acuta]